MSARDARGQEEYERARKPAVRQDYLIAAALMNAGRVRSRSR